MKANHFVSLSRVLNYTLLLFLLIFGASCKKKKEEPSNTDLKTYESLTASTHFMSVWNVNQDTQNKIELPLVENGDYDFTVDWGDGTKDQITIWNDPKATHTYDINAAYTVSINGKIEGWAFKYDWGNFKPTSPYNKTLLEIKSWGPLVLGDTFGQFAGCENLNITATDFPDLSKTSALAFAFYRATKFNSNINNWDVSKITSMRYMFYQATAYDQPMDKWDVSKVTDMGGMFYGASAFNASINNWDVSQVADMGAMFNACVTFNKPLDKWNTSNVIYMNKMFNSASSFNQNISSWNTNKVTSYESFSTGSSLSADNRPKFK